MLNEPCKYGALLIDYDSEEFPVYHLVKPFTEEEHLRYDQAYRLLTAYQDESMFNYVKNSCIDLFDYIIKVGAAANESGTLSETDDRGSNIFDYVCSLTLAATNAFFVLQDQRKLKAEYIAKERGDDTKEKVAKIFRDLEDSSFGYRSILNLRNALVHVNLNSLTFSMSVGVGREPEFVLKMSRRDVLATRNLSFPKAAAKRAELEGLSEDPDVFALVTEGLPAIAKADGQVRDALYPESALQEASKVVRELIDVFDGRRGTYCLQTGPDFTIDRKIPSHTQLIPEALALAQSFS